MAHKGDTVKYHISTNTGTWKTIASLGEVVEDCIETVRIQYRNLENNG